MSGGIQGIGSSATIDGLSRYAQRNRSPLSDRSGASSANDLASALANFEKAAGKNPFESVKQSVLKKHDIDEDQYKALPTSQRDAIDQEIRDAVRRAMASTSEEGGKKGSVVDLTA